MRRTLGILGAAAGCALLALSACSKTEEPAKTSTGPTTQSADFVFTNGKVDTVDKANSWAQAVAVRGNQLVYVGDDAGAAAFVGDSTKKIDLGGK